ncbi:uncharacterized protein LTR77_003513 [Saxophila tyrrhenica]|uniref:Uncharacterized protein n=1 Tax=Saxophila tyrrhenica TaxID=1690608 RepID=A0AAV9PE04_9PEZI|nr:hypothetical protein LTR77_003513 [Saxophila tyrrhenica]
MSSFLNGSAKTSQPPQQTSPYRPFIKGRLPVPRDVFARSEGKDRAADEEIAKAAPAPTSQPRHPRGTREAWRQKMAASRRQNLREGVKTLRERKTRTETTLRERVAAKQAEREALVRMPEREDERLTTSSTGLNVHKLLHGPLEDPTRDARLAHKARNLTLHTSAKRANRMDNLHTLYMNARHFIVTPQQLDSAIDSEFGTPEQPRQFVGDRGRPAQGYGEFDDGGKWSSEVTSMWAHGRPATVQDMLNRAAQGDAGKTSYAVDVAEGGTEGVTQSRVRRIAEKLTGGKMDTTEQ